MSLKFIPGQLSISAAIGRVLTWVDWFCDTAQLSGKFPIVLAFKRMIYLSLKSLLCQVSVLKAAQEINWLIPFLLTCAKHMTDF